MEARIINVDAAQRRSPLRIAIVITSALFAGAKDQARNWPPRQMCHQYIDTIGRIFSQPIGGFIQQYRGVFKIFHHLIENKSCSRSDNVSVADCSASISSASLLIRGRFIPQLKFVELSSQHHFFVSPACCRRTLARSVSTCTIHLTFAGMAQQ